MPSKVRVFTPEQMAARAEAVKRYRERKKADPEFKKANLDRHKRWREANKEYCKEYKAEQYQANRAEIDAKNEAWEKANPERTRELKLESFHRNKDHSSLRVSEKKAEEQKAHDDLTIAKLVDPTAPAPALQQVLADQYEKRIGAKKEYMREYMREYEQRPERKEYMREYYRDRNAADGSPPAISAPAEEKIDKPDDGPLSQAKPITSGDQESG